MPSRRASLGTLVFTYYPLCLTCATTILNSLILIILYQKVFRQRPTILYMRAIALIDIVLLYGWNLDHFFRLKFGFEVDRLSVISCKLSTYLNHFLNQSSAWLRVCMCIDRFYSLNQIRHCRINDRHRRVIFSIVFTVIVIALVNIHLPIFACYSHNNGTQISGNSRSFRLYPSWSYINLALYNIIPFILMLTFNLLIIRHLILIKRTSLLQQSRIRHSSISIPILLSAFLFCLMTTPPAVIFGFFHKQLQTVAFQHIVLSLLDSIKYTYHSLSFLLYFVTLAEFRKEFFRLFQCRCETRQKLSQIINSITAGKANQYKIASLPISAITK
ncbi:unnamed protein product [Rotaria magnacalcarata]|uniref:G-protein coupled receptors family 1 profile domain-containing protein n=1 Tax=Rotaria magnacalcarata TaxID=392030 RepID=A0A815TG93_9BILA|nr:unnamed protein product [Rotaria magnacalcarata]CAF1537380.1 unnamed protein product [Rotaria magnacalcarata]CAF2179025.1 unnamed protein product [Rotaria magnacalcarata]CAF3895942.1 unnamed protein product [Rotaria magnacalcarata]CAF3931409.1 unnamed protein product [Rotaria magnacalcarata]